MLITAYLSMCLGKKICKDHITPLTMKIISYLFPSLKVQILASKYAMLPLRYHGKHIYLANSVIWED